MWAHLHGWEQQSRDSDDDDDVVVVRWSSATATEVNKYSICLCGCHHDRHAVRTGY